MKLPLILVAALLPMPAMAQSLDQTHERIWFPTGKTPMLYYKPISRSACPTSTGRHQAGKMALQPPKRCEEIAKIKRARQLAERSEPTSQDGTAIAAE